MFNFLKFAHHCFASVSPSGLVSTKFDVYKDEDSPVIYDIDEERALNEMRRKEQSTTEKRYRFKGINLERKLVRIRGSGRKDEVCRYFNHQTNHFIQYF